MTEDLLGGFGFREIANIVSTTNEDAYREAYDKLISETAPPVVDSFSYLMLEAEAEAAAKLTKR